MTRKRWIKNSDPIAGAENPKIAAVLAVYNKPRELELVLEGYRRQSFLQSRPKDFQLILADDGSSSDIEELFSRFSDQVSFPTTYLRQDHAGWGKPRMLNWAALECRAERIIFTDGDCIPHRHFVKAHYELGGKKRVCCGRRVDIMDKLGPRLTAEDVREGRLDSPLWLLRHILRKEIEFGEKGFYLPQPLAACSWLFSGRPTLIGSNFSLAKSDLVELNGFDESFTTPGIGEDTDMERRFQLAGLELKWVSQRAIQYHIWHPLTEVGEPSRRTFAALKAQGNVRAVKGLKEHGEQRPFPQPSPTSGSTADPCANKIGPAL